METVDSLLKAALALSEADRMKLMDGIAASLPADDLPFDPQLLETIRRRSGKYDAGLVTSIPWQEVKERGAALHSTWQAEIDRRAKEIEGGTAEYVTWEEAKQYARNRVKEHGGDCRDRDA